MKKLLFTLLAAAISFNIFAQCDPATLKDMPTVYSKEYNASWSPSAEMNKYLTSVFTSVIEPALKGTKGLKGTWDERDGDWEFRGGFNATPDVLTSSTIQMYMAVMGCSKDKKIYRKEETGLVIYVDLNSLHFVSKMSELETYRNDKKVFLPNKIAGAQLYELKRSTASDKYASITFYKQTDEAKYFLITKKGSPFFVPVTVKQALELAIANLTSENAETTKQSAGPAILSKEAWIKKEGLQPMEGITAKQLQEVNDAGYQGYVEGSKGLVQQNNFNLDSQKKTLGIIKEYLKTAPAATLEKPATVQMMGTFYTDIAELKQTINEGLGDYLVTIQNNYLNPKLSKTAPQFICIKLEAQTNDAVTAKAFKDFEDGLDFVKLEQLLAR